MARKTSKITVTTPAGRTITLSPIGTRPGYWLSCGKIEVGNSTTAELSPARLAQLDDVMRQYDAGEQMAEE